MAGKPGRSPVGSRLSLESLEQRSMLAVAAFEIHLFEDVDGQPGAEITGDTVEAGETFFLEITAQEFAPYYHGLRGVALDISWDADVFTYSDESFDPSQVITSRLPMYQTGRLDNTAGEIIDLGGSAFTASDIGQPIGDGAPERFALLHFRALEASDASRIYMQPGRSRIVTVPTATPSRFEMSFERQMITVVSPAAADPVVIAPQTPTLGDSQAEPVSATVPAPAAGTTKLAPETIAAAQVGVQINLYEDAGGSPGSLIAGDAVDVGDTFFVEIVAADLRDVPEGISGLSLDVAWDAGVLREIDQPFNPSAAGSPLVTSSLPLFRTGSLNNAVGSITDLGGTSFRATGSGTPIGAGGFERFGLLHFEALATAEASPITLALGDSGAGLVGGAIRDGQDLDIEAGAVTVLDRRQPSQIALVGSSGPNANTIQFTTDLGGGVSTLVRPALPDTKQYIEVKNDGASPLTITGAQVNVPGVRVPALAGGAQLVLAPQETRRIGLTYAPGSGDPQTWSFEADAGLVLESDAANLPHIEIALAGAATFNGDTNYDGRVNIADISGLDNRFGESATDAAYRSFADPNGDGRIDLGDFGAINAAYGAARATAPVLMTAAAADAVFGASSAAGIDDSVVQALMIALASAEDDDAESDPFAAAAF